MMQTAPAAERMTTAIADGDSMRYYPAFDLPGRAALPTPRPETAAWAMQLLLVQRAGGGLTIGDTHVYDEPFDFAVEESLYDRSPGPGRGDPGLGAAPGGPSVGRRLHRGHRRRHLLPPADRAGGVGGHRPGRTGDDPLPGHRRADLGRGDGVTPPIRLVALDMAGTTVADDGAVEEAFQHALDAVGLDRRAAERRPEEYIRRTMGQSKITVFTELLGGDRHLAERANEAFEAAFDSAVDRGEVWAIPGAEPCLAALRQAGMRLCLTTGFSPATRDRIVSASGGRRWSTWCSPRPTPDGVGPGPT